MQFRQIVWLWLLIALFPMAQEESQVEDLFKINDMETRIEYFNYPWGEEISAKVQGYANNVLHRATLTVTILYEGKRITWASIPLHASGRSDIRFAWEQNPINKAAQEIFAGEYTLRLELNLSHQEATFSNQLKEILQEQNYTLDSKNPVLQFIEKKQYIKDTNQHDTQWEENQNFYIERIKNINGLFREFFSNRQLALALKRKTRQNQENPFAVNGEFSPEKWSQYWLEFNHQLEQEKKLLARFPEQVVVMLYPTTQNHLLFYCEMIENTTRFYNKALFDAYQIANDIPRQQGPYNMMDLRDILRQMREMHQDMGREMRVDLVKKIGYLPPPSIFNY